MKCEGNWHGQILKLTQNEENRTITQTSKEAASKNLAVKCSDEDSGIGTEITSR